MGCSNFVQGTLLRRKSIGSQSKRENLKRWLGGWDLAALGLGGGLGCALALGGAGPGAAVREAGPAALLAWLLAGAAALLPGLCYAEWWGAGAGAGASAGIGAALATLGELPAFLLGWAALLDAVLVGALAARALTMAVDDLAGGAVTSWLAAAAPLPAPPLAAYADLLALALTLLTGAVQCCSTRGGMRLTAAVTCAGVAVVVGAAAARADPANWSISPGASTEGAGGFFPWGAEGVARAAALAYRALGPVDLVCSAADEVRHGRPRWVPWALVSAVAVAVVQAALAAMLTLAAPYHLSGVEWTAALGAALRVAIATATAAAATAGVWAMVFRLSRLLGVLSSHGLFLPALHRVSARGIPVLATLLAATLIGVAGACVGGRALSAAAGGGALLSHVAVAVATALRRYDRDDEACSKHADRCSAARLLNAPLLLLMFVCVTVTSAAVSAMSALSAVSAGWAVMVALHAAALLLLTLLALQPQRTTSAGYQTPLVPALPCVVAYVSAHVLALLGALPLLVWLALGLVFYVMLKCFCKQSDDNSKPNNHVIENDKPPIEIIIDGTTPPETSEPRNHDDLTNTKKYLEKQKTCVLDTASGDLGIIMQTQTIETNEEKEAIIIDLLDQVLQAEEDNYKDLTNDTEIVELVETVPNTPNMKHFDSFSELSDAGSDASLGNQILSKYDVIAQVHREDLPKVAEEEERGDAEEEERRDAEEEERGNAEEEERGDAEEEERGDAEEEEKRDIEETASEEDVVFNETDSRTDESGYSDTLDRNTPNDSIENLQDQLPEIPAPPPLNENFFESPVMRKAYSIPRPSKPKYLELEEFCRRESVNSNESIDDGNIVFGSDKQMHFMTKLNTLFLKKINNVEKEQRPRSHSTGSCDDNISLEMRREAPISFKALKKEILARDLRSAERNNSKYVSENEQTGHKNTKQNVEDESLSREELKSKLENIFATGGPKPVRTRVIASNPPTPEEPEVQISNTVKRLPKVDKNDTLHRQKAKFGEVLNSLTLTLKKSGEEI